MAAREQSKSFPPNSGSAASDKPSQNRPRAGPAADEPTIRLPNRGKALGSENRTKPAETSPSEALRSAPPNIQNDFAPRSQFAPQDVLAGRFRLISFIGRGGMGEVYEAEDLELHERVALKTVRADRGPDAGAIARF